MTEEELDALALRLLDWPMCEWNSVIQMRKDASTAITALRTRLAEVQEDRDAGAADYCALMERHDAEKVRADRAEAERAAQIEVEPVAWRWESCANSQGWNTRYGCEKPTPSDYITDIVPLYATQPHDRSALDRMLAEAREKALREAAELCSSIRQRIANGPMPEGARFDYEQSILALIEKP